MKISILFILLLIFMSSSFSAVYADVIEPGKKNIPTYYVIDNINSYPDYVFLLHGTPSPDYLILNSSVFSFYKFSNAKIYAVPRSSFNEAYLKEMNQTDLDTYFNNNSKVLSSNLKLEAIYKTVGNYDPLESTTAVLTIKSINSSQLNIVKSRMIFQYSDGNTAEKPYTDQNSTPNSPSGVQDIFSWWYIIVPILAFLVLLIILWGRRQEW